MAKYDPRKISILLDGVELKGFAEVELIQKPPKQFFTCWFQDGSSAQGMARFSQGIGLYDVDPCFTELEHDGQRAEWT